ncbi:MAG TPA: hypothetical protein VEY71_07775 [Chitinophagales bacterium]|nr:hypothetical protein [Chitinophagales bacterium]
MKPSRFCFAIALVMLLSVACRKTVDVNNVQTLIQTGAELHAVDASGDTIVAVGGARFDYGSIFVSYDAGQNWQRFDSISIKALYAVQMVTPTRFIATGFEGKLFESSDAGQTWQFTQLHWNNIRAVHANDTAMWMCGGKGLDNGFVTRHTNPSSPNDYALDTFQHELRSLLRTPDSTLYCGGYGIVMRSHDEGITWQPTSAESDFFIGLVFVNGTLYAAGMNGTVLESTDGGDTWEHVKRGNNPVNVKTLWNAFAADDEGLLLVGENGKCFFSNGGKWQRLDLGTAEDFTGIAIATDAYVLTTRQGSMLRFPRL